MDDRIYSPEDLLSSFLSLLSPRSKTTLSIYMLLLANKKLSSNQIANLLAIDYNIVEVHLHQLVKKGLVERQSRGVYKANARPILLFLLAFIKNMKHPSRFVRNFLKDITFSKPVQQEEEQELL